MTNEVKYSRNLGYFEPLLIGFFWILLFASPLMFGKFENIIDWSHIVKIWKDHLLLLALFLVNRFILLPWLFFRNKRMIYVFCTAILILSIVTGRYLFYVKASQDRKPATGELVQRPPRPRADRPPAGKPERDIQRPPVKSQPEPLPPYVNLLILSVLIVGFDTGLKVTSKWSQSEQLRIKLEKENVENQLAFLRNQVSPHFFMNTLNNIHALIDYDSGEAKKSIIKLSNLMRHLLYESEAEKSPLINEVEFIKSYVDLMRLRFSDKVKISLKVPDIIPDKKIPPLIFTSILENAFKHGISYTMESFIDIELSLQTDRLSFRVQNSNIKPSKDNLYPGIGIENTRKRLDLLYQDNYALDITDRGNIFITNLTIPV